MTFCESEPAIPHPHQDRLHLSLRLGFRQAETAICFLREVHLVRHCTLPIGHFGTTEPTGIVGRQPSRNYVSNWNLGGEVVTNTSARLARND